MASTKNHYDAVVVGCGPAGSVSAALLAARGWHVLLIEKAPWPRGKACGGCINAAGVRLLRDAGLGAALDSAAPLYRMELLAAGRHAAFDLPHGAVIDRCAFDASLVDLACARGAHFAPNTRAALEEPAGETPLLRLHSHVGEAVIHARLVLVCDGLASPRAGFLSQQPWARVDTAPDARLGFAATVEAATLPTRAPGTLQMCVGDAGYVGVVRLPGGAIHLGAALEPAACNSAHGPLPVMRGILRACGVEDAALDAPDAVIGTGPLTRWRNTFGRGRILALGDACGYVEPFTGEGIAWALHAARAAAALLPQSAADVPDDIGDRWHEHFRTHLRPRQDWCRRLRPILARPRLARLGIRMARALPRGAQLLARHISA